MAYNYDINEGKYPGEPGYKEWTGFEEQFKIPGTTSKYYKPIHPLTFHSQLLKNHLLLHSKKGETYTDYKIRCNAELEKNNKFFQPKGWNFDKLLYNYDLLFHIKNQDNKVNERLIKALKEHLKPIYETYKVNIKDRAYQPKELHEMTI